MSLQVWLPLTGDLHNQGLADITATNNGATYSSTGGKFGGCYTFGGSSYIDTNYGNGLSVNNTTIACWFKPTADCSNDVVFGALNGSNQRCYVGISNSTYNLAFGSTTYGRVTTASVVINEWAHIAMTVENNEAKLYVNGNFIESLNNSTSFNLASNFFIGGRSDGYKTNSLVNDVRIYNHALTEKEVREISRGLVLHYPLNDRYAEATHNLVQSLKVGNRTVIVDNDKIQNTGVDADTYFYVMNSGLVAGETYTISYYCQGLTGSDSSWKFGVGAQLASHANHCGYIAINNGWNELTFICPESLDGNKQLILDDFAATWRTSIVTFSHIQLEHNSKRTPYTPFDTVSDGTTNILTGNAKKITTWTNYMPSYVAVSENTEGCKYTLLQGVGGWEKIFTDAISVEVGKNYTLSFDYTVEQSYSGYSGSFGLSVCGTSQAAYGNDTDILGQLQFGTSQLSRRRGYITFTATTDEVYLVANGGRIADGSENISFVIDKLVLAEATAFDISGHQHNGTIYNGIAVSSNTPRYRSCVDIIDGAYIDTGFMENIGTGDFTISVWIKMPQTSGKTYQPIFSNKTTGAVSVGFAIYFNQNQNKLLWSTADGSSSTEIWTANTVDIYDKWTHIVMVRNSNDARKGYFYINGERWELASIPPIRDISNNTYTIQLGDIATHTHSTYRYVGLMSDFRLYTTALSAADIQELYEMGVGV